MSIDLHSLAAPYALDSLDDLERIRFEHHLASCEDCRTELSGFVATADRIASAQSTPPPPALRARLMAEIAETPQRRPVVTTSARVRRSLARGAVAAAVVLGAVGVGGYVVEHQRAEQVADQNVAMTDQNRAMTDILSARDAVTSTKRLGEAGVVRLVSSSSQGSAVMVADRLDSPGEGKTYQLWMIDASGPHPQGTFDTAGMMIVRDLGDADRVAITVEPAGGSTSPTTPPVATIAV